MTPRPNDRGRAGGRGRGSGGRAPGSSAGGRGGGADSRGKGTPGRSGIPEGRRPPDGGRSRGLGGEQVEGRRAVHELLLARTRRTRDVWVSVDRGVDPILDLAAAAHVPVRRVARASLDAEARTESPQGVLAHAEPLPEADLDGLVGGVPFLVALDGVTDPQNLGALLRTACSAGATGMILPRHRAAHVTPAVAKAAAGAIEHVPIAVVPGIPAVLQTLATHGVWTVGLDAEGSLSLWDLELATAPVALVLGAEGTGLSRLARDRCDVVVRIPHVGPLGSLNVAAAGAVAAFEVARRRSVSSTA